MPGEREPLRPGELGVQRGVLVRGRRLALPLRRGFRGGGCTGGRTGRGRGGAAGAETVGCQEWLGDREKVRWESFVSPSFFCCWCGSWSRFGLSFGEALLARLA